MIKAYEIHTNPEAGRCITDCPYHGECVHNEEMKDALYYLKEYKIKRERIMAKAQDCEDTEKRLQDEIARYQETVKEYEEILTDYVALKQYWAEQQANPALSWEELQQMEGKPVWVEHLKDGVVYKAGWCLIVQVDDSLPDIPCVGLVDTDADYHNLEVEWMDMGQWQAYRKERV